MNQVPMPRHKPFAALGAVFSKANLARFMFLVACLITLVGLFYAEENWRGYRAWREYRTTLEQAGESFGFESFIPAQVSDDRNFASAAFLKTWLDYEETPGGIRWRDKTNRIGPSRIAADLGPGKPPRPLEFDQDRFTDLGAWQGFYRNNTNYPQVTALAKPAESVQGALAKFDPLILDLIQAMRTRPLTRFPVQYQSENPYRILLPHLAHLRALCQILQLRAAAHLELGQSTPAFEELQLGFRLADSVREEPFLVSHLVRLALLHLLLEDVKGGLLLHRWSPDQTDWFERQFATIDLIKEFAHCIRGERAMSLRLVELARRGKWESGLLDETEDSAIPRYPALVRLAPSGWFYRNALFLARAHQEKLFPTVDVGTGRISRAKFEDSHAFREQLESGLDTIAARLLLPANMNVLPKTARAQTSINQALIACELERAWRATGRYPETLAELEARVPGGVREDPVGGKPMHYRRLDGGEYLLYSEGWNEKDDGGSVAASGKGNQRVAQPGDWVWSRAR